MIAGQLSFQTLILKVCRCLTVTTWKLSTKNIGGDVSLMFCRGLLSFEGKRGKSGEKEETVFGVPE